MNAEALEVQGKWDEAAKQYEEILAQDPKLPGIHYLIGRILLSKPDADAARIASAKQELIQELEIDPKNAGAEYVLGVLARQESNWDEAIRRFSSAAKLDAGFGDAFWGWGVALVSAKKYEEAIAPLQAAVRLQPGNPSAHYNLGMALSRTGRSEEAQKEFAIQKEIIARLDEKKNARTEVAKPE
jgi:tetratricopeptide (TPR) repeat protein